MLIDARKEIDTETVKDTDEVIITGSEFKNRLDELDTKILLDSIYDAIDELQYCNDCFQKRMTESFEKLQKTLNTQYEDLHKTIAQSSLKTSKSKKPKTFAEYQEQELEKVMNYFK